MYGSDATVIRGQHANRKTEFVLINVSGTSKVKVDNGYETDVIELNKPRMGLYLPTMLWKDMYDFFRRQCAAAAWQANTMTAVNIFGTIMNI